ncbi:hypothetical protein [Reichenbachiella sp.]
MALINLWNEESTTDDDREMLSENISRSAYELDDIIKKLNDLLTKEAIRP